MNKDQVKGTFKDIAGKTQEQAGKLVGNKEQQAKGLLKQAEGKSEKKFGDVKEIVKDAAHQRQPFGPRLGEPKLGGDKPRL